VAIDRDEDAREPGAYAAANKQREIVDTSLGGLDTHDDLEVDRDVIE
jgi:hypothetical protein